MFIRLVADSFSRRPRHKLLTGAALALGMAVATAALSVSLDVGDRLAHEFRSLGANLVVTPQADSLPLEIGGVDYRPANTGAYLSEADLPRLKTIFWRNNIVGFAPILEVPILLSNPASGPGLSSANPATTERLFGTWARHQGQIPGGSTFVTGIEKTNPWWHVEGRWFEDQTTDCVVGIKLARRLHLTVGSKLTIFRPHGAATGSSSQLAVVGLLETGGPEEDKIVGPLSVAQAISGHSGQYRELYVSALTKPEDDFGRRNPSTMNAEELERWSCSPYVSSIAYSIGQVLPGAEVRVIRRVAEGEGAVLTRVQMLLWLVTLAALLAAGLAVAASAAASVIARRTEIGLMKALGAGSGTVGFLLAAEQLLLAFVGGGFGYALGIVLARLLGEKIFGVAPPVSLPVFVVILGLAAGVTLLGSAIPMRRASRYQPAPILRGE